MPPAILFPGQGASVAGSAPLAEQHCADLLTRARQRLGDDPFERAGDSTQFAQPAIFLASLAGWRSIREDVEPRAFAGHSLGEITALVAAGALSDRAGLDLVIRRASLMAEAAQAQGDGGMLAVLKGTPADAQRLAEEQAVSVATDNGEGQTVLSGSREALRRAAGSARERGLRAIALDVTGAFHSPAMAPAVEPLRETLRAVRLTAPSAPVYSGLTARPFGDVPAELARAVCAPVRWRETMLALDRLGIDTYIDVGPDEILARLVERNLLGRTVRRIQDTRVAA